MKLYLIALFMILLTVNISYAYLNSTIICISNTTLQENWTVYKDGNQTNLTINTWCENECDNVTMTCQQPKYVQNVIIIGIIGLVGFVIVKLIT